MPEGDGLVKIIFSRRGGLSYQDFKNYLQVLRNTLDDTVRIHWPVIDVDGIEAKDHSASAGLQLADIAASAITAGVESDYFGNCEKRYAEIIKPVIYNRSNNYLSYGLKIVPRPEEMLLSDQQLTFIDLFK